MPTAGNPRPLTKMVGVEFTPTFAPNASEALMASLAAGVAAQAAILTGSWPALVSASFNVASAVGPVSPDWFSNKASENLKKASLPPALATQYPWVDALKASLWIWVRGKSWKTKLAL